LGLDKWIGSEEPKKKPKKSGTEPKITQNLETKVNFKINRHHLVCSKAKCKYQKVIMKKELEPQDLICPKCKSKMKIK